MTAAQVLYVAVLAAVGIGVCVIAQRMDRPLGLLVGAMLPVYFAAAFAMGWYLNGVRHREYFAPDEAGFQEEAQRIIDSWDMNKSYIPVYPSIYPTVNAVVIKLWGGRSLVPMRLLNALMAVLTLPVAFLMALELFGSVAAARWAAALVAFSPSLILWALTNEKERAIGLAALLVTYFGARLMRQWQWSSLAALAVSLIVLGELRHYWAALIGWILLVVFPGAYRGSVSKRVALWAVLFVVVGGAQAITSGHFLALNMRNEGVRRYVTSEQTLPAESSTNADFSLQGERGGRALPATTPTAVQFVRSAAFVLFGRFTGRRGAGHVASLYLVPDWISMFALVPLFAVGTIVGLRRGRLDVLLPAGFVLAMILLLTYLRDDEWTTYRFRALYWPIAITIASGGVCAVWDWATRIRARWQQSAPMPQTPRLT